MCVCVNINRYLNDFLFLPKVGDTIVLVKSIDADWLKGELKGKEGIFPRSFVQVLKDPLWDTLAETERWICGAVLNLANHLFVPKEHKAREHSSQANLVVEVINQMFYYLWTGMYCSHLEAVGEWVVRICTHRLYNGL